MFCPQCKAEYKPGYTTCADCGVPLVDQLPPEPEPDEPADAVPFGPDTELVHVFDTFNPGDMALIKSILDGEGIPYVFEGEHSQYVYGAVPFRLMVDSQDADKVREVLKQLDLSHGQTNTAEARLDEADEDQDTGEAAWQVDEEANIPLRPTGLSMKWVLVGLLIAGAWLAYSYQSGNDSAADLLVKGRNAVAKGNFREARSYYEKAIKLNPRSDDLRDRVGVTYEMEGDLKDALRLYDEAIGLNPRNSDARSRRAYVLIKLRDYKRALQEINSAIDLNPLDVHLRAWRGIIYARLRNYQQALTSYTEAIDLDPDFAFAYANRGLAWEHLGDADQAKKNYDKVLQLEPKGPQDYVSRGIAHQRLGRFSDAVGDFDQALVSFAKESDGYSWRGWSYLFFEDYDRAAADCSKAIDLDPGNYSAYCCRARAYNGSGKGRAAIEDCSKAIGLEPDGPAGYAWMAWTLATCQEQKYRDGKRALQYAREAVARAEKAKEGYLAEYYDALGAAYAETGDFSQAAQTEMKTLGLHRPPGAIIRDNDEARELTEAYKSGQTYVQWRGKKSKNER